MVIAPFDIEDVLTPVSQLVGDSVLSLALVLDVHLVAGFLWAVDADKEYVVPGMRAVH